MLDNGTLFSGYKVLSDDVSVLEPRQVGYEAKDAQFVEPETVVIFAWGDGHPKHVVTYAESYRKLYSSSRIIVVCCTLVGSIYQYVARRTQAMLPVVHAAVPPRVTEGDTKSGRVLVHIMSNSGTVSFIATLLAYKMLRKGEASISPFPCALLVCDSAPGGNSYWGNIGRWSHALSLASPSWVPLPLLLMQALWCTVLLLGEGLTRAVGWDAVGRVFPGPISEPELLSTEASRLYLYSKADKVGGWEDVEDQVARASEKGYICKAERFELSPHVGHMRLYPNRYWKAIEEAWKASV